MARSFVDHRWEPPRKLGFALDSPLEGGGFEPSVPRQKDLCKRSPATASTGGAQLNPGVRFFGHWLEYNEPAARDAKQKLRALSGGQSGRGGGGSIADAAVTTFRRPGFRNRA